ncbi:MAG: 4'-phosphopantetheinyl transferase, partial [Planctomycetota bacterium]|nr:4'-phosphopantetheinyl transferase [Planctomycetota bacterium]
MTLSHQPLPNSLAEPSQQRPSMDLEPSSPWTIAPDEVHVWHGSLLQPDEVIQRLASLLDQDEQQRSARYRFERHRKANIVARGMLRDVLSRYLQIPGQDLCFNYNAHGKPALKSAALPHSTSNSLTDLRFNLSHSGQVVVCAV